MLIHINEKNQQFHLTNGQVSYIFHVMKNGQLGHLYYGKALRHREDFSHFQAYDVPIGYSAMCTRMILPLLLKPYGRSIPHMGNRTLENRQ